MASNIDKKLEYWKNQKEKKSEELVDKFIQNNNLSDIVSPYMYNKDSENILKYILGRKEMDKIIGLNALAYSGVINTTCPPPNAPDQTEEFLNIMTGKKECREPIPKRKQLSGVDKCKEGLEKYIDFFGKAHCQRPVLSGAFSCPPKGDPSKLKRVVLKNNVGICVEDPLLTKGSKKFVIPAQLVYFNDKINEKMVDMLNYLNQSRLSNDILMRLGNILKYNRSLSDIKSGLSRDPEYEIFALMADNLHEKDDVHIAKSAYMYYLLQNNPELAKELMGTAPDEDVMSGLKMFLGIEINN